MRAEKAIDAQTAHILALTAELQAQQALISKVSDPCHVLYEDSLLEYAVHTLLIYIFTHALATLSLQCIQNLHDCISTRIYISTYLPIQFCLSHSFFSYTNPCVTYGFPYRVD